MLQAVPDRLSAPYFPKASGVSALRSPPNLPKQPTRIGPICDPASTTQPLGAFKQAVHDANYTYRDSDPDSDLPPPNPEQPSDPYLVPSLTRHERLRLTLLWYYTRDLLKDQDFLQSLQEKLNMVKQLMGWQYAIMGIMSEDVFSRIVTAGVPLVVLPRRESMCSHTINQPSGVSPLGLGQGGTL